MHKIIKELESDNSRLAKESILYRELAKDNQTLFYGFQIALDNLVTFGVKQVPESFGNGQDYHTEHFLWNVPTHLQIEL